jgi:hypothetical protein
MRASDFSPFSDDTRPAIHIKPVPQLKHLHGLRVVGENEAMVRGFASKACLLALMTAAAGAAHAQSLPARAERSGGIWKAAVPPQPMRGEFGSLDPLGVAAGARIKADCSLNWINPDDGKLYCFASGTSLEFFLEQPQAHLERARVGWRKMTAGRE